MNDILVHVYERTYGNGRRWRLEAGKSHDRVSVECGSRERILPIARAIAKSLGGRLVIEPAPEQLTIVPGDGIAEALAHTDSDWAAVCDAAIRALASTGEPFTAYDLHAMVPEPSNPNHWGPRLPVAAKRGLIRKVGYRKSSRPGTRGSAVAVWCGTTEDAA